MASLDVPTNTGLLPSFVIGYEGARRDPPDPPPWLHVFQHQYGGHSCLQFELTGCALPLAMNQLEGTGKLWLLTRALVELGESFPGDSIYRASEVAGLVTEIASLACSGHGDEMTAPQVADLAKLFGSHLAFPGLTPPVAEWGCEAVIRFRADDCLPFFDGWRVVCGECPIPDGEPTWRDCERYNRELARTLQSLVGRGEPPRIFLLWENSD